MRLTMMILTFIGLKKVHTHIIISFQQSMPHPL